jgi:hypothetical protein
MGREEMFSCFWKKKPSIEGTPRPNVERLRKPQNLPQAVGRDLIVHLAKDPGWVWTLKSVVHKSRKGKHRYNVRVFDQAQAAAKGVNVMDYTSLDDHPELILFRGWYDRKSWKAHIEEIERSEPMPKAA